MKYPLSLIVLPVLAAIASGAPVPGCLKRVAAEEVKSDVREAKTISLGRDDQHPRIYCEQGGLGEGQLIGRHFFPGGFPGRFPSGFPGYPGHPGAGLSADAKTGAPPGDVYAHQLPANTMGSGNWANKNEWERSYGDEEA
ncbi:hypothetical protein FBU30_006119 [Linnemannia zychae]|nr:hypothetical protein FBU30_006119 [Linnemannia zychae]